MRVLLVTDHFPPFIGGGHRWAGLLTAGLARAGHEVTVATPWHKGESRSRVTPEGARVEPVRQLRTLFPRLVKDNRQQHAPPFPDPVSIFDLRRVIRTAAPDVVLTHGWIAASLMVALWRSEVPVAISAHDYGYFCATRRLLHNDAMCSGPSPAKCLGCAAEYYGRPKGWIAVAGVGVSRRLIARRIAATQSVTSFVDAVIHRFVLSGSDAERPRRWVVPPFIDMSTENPENSRQIAAVVEQLPREPFILFVGAFRRDKGLEVLFEAYRSLEDPPPLVLLGTLERDTPAIPAGVTAVYDVPHEAVVLAWNRAILGVVPSLLPEPLGTVCVEGIAQGVPMIATEPSGMADVLRDATGLLIPQNDAPALAAAMRTLLSDARLRERLIERGLRRADDFRADHVLTRYEAMLTELVSERDRSRKRSRRDARGLKSGPETEPRHRHRA